MLLQLDAFVLWGIICPTGVFSFTRVLHELLNSTAYFQATVKERFSKIRENMVQYVDDFNLQHKNEDRLLNLIEEFAALQTTTI